MSSDDKDWPYWRKLCEDMHVAGTQLWQARQEAVSEAIKGAKIFIFTVDCFIRIVSGGSIYSETFANVTWKMCLVVYILDLIVKSVLGIAFVCVVVIVCFFML